MHRVRSLHIARYGLLPILIAPLGCAFEFCPFPIPCKDANTEATASGSTLGSTSSTSTSVAAATTGTSSEGESTGGTSTTSATQTTASTTSATSTTQATAGPSCGDGVVDDGEECDDRNNIDTDKCTTECKKATCGDGHIQEGIEECDPAAPEGPYCDLDCKELVAIAVAAGDAHTCALLEQAINPSIRRVRCWGKNSSNQLGYSDDNLTFQDKTPRAVYAETLQSTHGNLGLDTNIAQVVAGPGKTCFILDTGLLRCTGAPHTCDFPTTSADVDMDGAIDLDKAPNITFPGYTNWRVTALSLGTKHSCATLADNNLNEDYVCWQPSHPPPDGGLGLTDMCPYSGNACPKDAKFTVSKVVNCPPPPNSALEGCTHASNPGGSCYITKDRQVRCWGTNNNYSAGLPELNPIHPCESKNWPTGSFATQVAAGLSHYCAIKYDVDTKSSKGIYCWGTGGNGRLGPNSADDKQHMDPMKVFPVADNKWAVRQLALGSTFSCALSSEDRPNGDELYCWGTICDTRWSDIPNEKTPTIVSLPGGDAPVKLSASVSHICAVGESGMIYCAGDNTDGKSGHADSSCTTAFTLVQL